MSEADKVFAGSIPENYDRYMVPLIFESYAPGYGATRQRTGAESGAGDRGRHRRGHARAGAAPCPDASYVVDRPQPADARLCAASKHADSRIVWQKADAQALPFDDARLRSRRLPVRRHVLSRRPAGYREARRVLKPGGIFLFNVWDRIEENVFADVRHDGAGDALSGRSAALHGAHAAWLSRHCADPERSGEGRFRQRGHRDREAQSVAPSPAIPRSAYCQGTPLRNEIEARGPDRLEAATEHAASAIASRHGSGEVSAKIQAHVIWRGHRARRPHRLIEAGSLFAAGCTREPCCTPSPCGNHDSLVTGVVEHRLAETIP